MFLIENTDNKSHRDFLVVICKKDSLFCKGLSFFLFCLFVFLQNYKFAVVENHFYEFHYYFETAGGSGNGRRGLATQCVESGGGGLVVVFGFEPVGGTGDVGNAGFINQSGKIGPFRRLCYLSRPNRSKGRCR